MIPQPRSFGALEDWHVHSTWSDGQHTLEQNLASAEALGLKRLCCVDHVRRSSAWVTDFGRAVAALDHRSEVEVLGGVEAKFLDEYGTLDLPADVPLELWVFAADHQLPWRDGVLHPREARARLEDGRLTPELVGQALCRATVGAARRHPRVVIAHLFSILPKIGLSEEQLDEELLYELGEGLADARALVEISERWRCPSPRVRRVLAGCGVELVWSTDSHQRERIGAYPWVRASRCGLRSPLVAPRHG